MYPYPFNDTIIETNYGKFYIRSGTTDAVTVSPAYEYLDKKFLKEIIKQEIEKGNKILFIDVGSNIGSYCVYVENILRNFGYTGNAKIFAFEADRLNYDVLTKNLSINSSSVVKPYNFAVLDKSLDNIKMFHNEKLPGCSHIFLAPDYSEKINTDFIQATSIDDFFNKNEKIDISEFSVIIKIDVEGADLLVLQGALNTLRIAKNFYICIESFYNSGSTKKIVNLLAETGKPYKVLRFTPYNIWILS